MEKPEALAQLKTGNVRERLEAARSLASTATAADVDAIRRARRRESVVWVKAALDRAIATAQAELQSDEPPDFEDEEGLLVAEVRAQAVEEISDRLVHEINPILGVARLAASREVPAYESSKTKAQLDRLEHLVNAIDTLGHVSSAPDLVEFDLPTLVQAEVDAVEAELDTACTADSSIVRPRITLHGPIPLRATGDPGLIRLALRNATQNAIEAAIADFAAAPEITVAWDSTDRDYWIAVIDNGPGVSAPAISAFEIGTTTKRGHLGMGLALVKRAATSLKGSVVLESSEPGSTRFEFRWPYAELEA